MSCFQPPFNGAEPSLEDGCGFFTPTPAPDPAVTPPSNTQRGFVNIPQAADRVSIIFPTPLALGTDYDIEVSTENLKTGDPDESIYPTVLISRDHDSVHEIGFTYGINSPPTTGPGTFGPDGSSLQSYTRFNWQITWHS